MQIEVERKWVLDSDLHQKLPKLLGEGIVSEEEDEYFFNPNLLKDIDFSSFAVRLRKKNQKTMLQLKGVRDEFFEMSTEISPETAGFLSKMFAQIGLKKIATVKKTRETFEQDGLKITADQVEGLGKFIEIESTKGSLKDVMKCAEELGVKQEVKSSYLTQMLKDTPWEQFFQDR